MIRIGTSGFKFDDWKGHFYPEGLNPKKWLEYYAGKFDCLEVNSTYYRLLHPATFFHMANKVPDGFLFTVKAYRTLTHEINKQTDKEFDDFVKSLEPLQEQGKFGCVLAQFPTSFHNTEKSRAYIAEFQERMGGLAVVVEFRNRDWLEEATFVWLRGRGLGFCGVDEPQFKSLVPPVVRATAKVGYLRFHGRNYKDWWSGDKNKRYDYLYSEEELAEWLPKIKELAKETEVTYVFMNNCYQGQAAKNAGQLQGMLEA